jgi:ankyrin repeat protein
MIGVANARSGPVDGRLDLDTLAAIEKSELPAVLRWLQDTNTHIEDTTRKGHTALIWSVHCQSLVCLQLFISSGSSVNAATRNGVTALHIAAQNGSLAILSALARAGCNLNPEYDTGETPLIAAVQHGQEDSALMLMQFGARVNHCNKVEGDATAVFAAARGGRPVLIKLLAANGANVNISGANGVSPIYVAVEEGHAHCLKQLLDAGANAKSSTVEGVTALYAASSNGAVECVEILLDRGAADPPACVNTCAKDGSTPLFAACKHYKLECARLLIAAGASVRVVRNDGTSLDYIARASDNRYGGGGELVALVESRMSPLPRGDMDPMIKPAHSRLGANILAMLKRGNESIIAQWLADPTTHVDDTSQKGETALLISAASDTRTKITARLIDAGANLECTAPGPSPGSERSAILVACTSNSVQTATLLLSAGANINAGGAHVGGRRSIVVLAALLGHSQCLALALEFGAYADPAALHAAVERGDHRSMAKLVAAGAAVDARQDGNRRGHTALSIACTRGDIQGVKLLVKADARMDLAFDELEGDSSGRGSLLSGATALHIAVKNGHSALVKVLVEAGAGINARTTDLDEQQSPVYQSPIHVAVLNHRTDCLLQLIMAGGNVDATNGQGLTPVHYCCTPALPPQAQRSVHVHVDCLRLLIKAKATLDAKTKCASDEGNAAIHLAASAGDIVAVEMLIKAGADRNITTTKHHASPLLLAAREHHTAVVELLLSYRSDPNATLMALADECAAGGAAVAAPAAPAPAAPAPAAPAPALVVAATSAVAVADDAGSTALDLLIQQDADTELVATMKAAGALAPVCEPNTLVGAKIEIGGKVAVVSEFLSSRSFFDFGTRSVVGDPETPFMLKYSSGAKEQVLLQRAGNCGRPYKIISSSTHLNLEREFWKMNIEAAVADQSDRYTTTPDNSRSRAYERIVAVIARDDMRREIDVQRCCIDRLLHELLETRPETVTQALANHEEIDRLVLRVQSTFPDDDHLCEQCATIQKILNLAGEIVGGRNESETLAGLRDLIGIMTTQLMGRSTAVPSLLILGSRALFSKLQLVTNGKG